MAPTLPPLDGLYFGVSDTPDGKRAWLVRFGPAAGGGGRLYAPPDNPELTGTNVLEHPDSVVLRSRPGLGGVYYVLTAHAEGGTVRGAIETVRAGRAADSVVARSTVTLSPVPRMPEGPAGLYSNVALNDDSGDLVGEEVTLLPAPEGRWNAIVAGLDGDFAPYAASEVQRSGRTLELGLRTASGAESYQIAFVPGGGLTFTRSNPTPVTSDEPNTLTRRRVLSDLLVDSTRSRTK